MIEDLWYKNTVIYSLDLETFMDGNNDGVGDFEGLNSKLDYLHAMGVDTIWLAPFYPTPNKDNGYDVKDFYGVDPRHGTSGEFVAFIQKAHKMGIKVILDLVVNHTSDQHPWFRESRSSKDSRLRDWYVWSEKKPKNWDQGMVFPGVQEATWTKDEKSGEYYFHRFYKFQPDLNTDNPEVRAEILRIMGYWLQLGVHGFRVDAVPFILESPSTDSSKQPLHFEYLKEMRKFLQWRRGDAILLGEANVLPEDSMKYFGENSDGIHLMFNFYVNQYLFHALASGTADRLITALEQTRIKGDGIQWAQFLRNHDELDIDRLADDEKQLVFKKFGPEKNMHLYERGIRRRLTPMLGSRQETELAYSLMFSLPGTPVLRYGDEIGMGDNLRLNERNAVRTPMQWSGDKNAGFSETDDKLVHPVIDEGFFSYKHVNVENQRRDPGSLLNWITSMIRLRKECSEIGWGDWSILKSGSPGILAMKYTWKSKSLLIVHNLGTQPCELVLSEKDAGARRLVDLINNEESESDERNRHTVILPSFGYRWFRVGEHD